MENHKTCKKDITIVLILLTISILVLVLIGMNESISDNNEAELFCNSINMSYLYDGYQMCYVEDSMFRYVIKIVRSNDNSYRLIRSGERL